MRVVSIVSLMLFSSLASADFFSIPNSFTNGAVADADAVNANFTALADESNEDDLRIEALESGISLSNNDAGTYNTLFGKDAGRSIASGAISNTAIGHRALFSPTTGSDNVAAGAFAIYSNTTGYRNTAIGSSALYSNTEGANNTGVGYHSLRTNTTGNFNTSVGMLSLYSNTTGTDNAGLGNTVLYGNTTGLRNTASGSYALRYNTTGSYNTASGYRALYSNTTASSNTANGYRALTNNTTGIYNTAIGSNSLLTNTRGHYNVAIGYQADTGSTNISNAIAIGYNAKVYGSNRVRLGNTDITKIDVQVALSVTSDRRLKENIQTTPLGLDFINALNPVQYHRINNKETDLEMGLIAQELLQVLEKNNATQLGLVDTSDKNNLSVRYNDLFAPLIKSVQQLSTENTALKSELLNIKSELAEIRRLMSTPATH